MTVRTKIAQPLALRKRITAAMTASRARSPGRSARVRVFATEPSTGHPPRDARRSGGTALPPRTPAVGARQATGLVPLMGLHRCGTAPDWNRLRFRGTIAAVGRDLATVECADP